MQMTKKITTAIALFLISAFAVSLVAIPAANAHTPSWTIISYAYLVVSPSPVGVGQTETIVMWIDTPMVGAALGNDIRRHDYTITITAPNGAVTTQNFPDISDPTGVQTYRFVPDQVGIYTVKFDYPQQTYTWSGAYQGDTFTAASKTTTFTVQEESIPSPIDSYPLPTQYWTRPIEGQNTYWYTIASNWLGTPYIPGAGAAWTIPGSFQPYGSAPNSAHVMWTKPIQFGGVVGGNDTAIPGEGYYQGLSYNVRFGNPIIMQGTLYYQEPYGNSGGGGDYVAVDLRTGQELWRINATAGGVPSFGYLYSFESPNQHGILPNGLLIATSGRTTQTWQAYDPRTGVLTTMNITNVPSGTAVAGPSGEYLKYVLTNLGTNANPKWYLMQWNSSNVIGAVSSLGAGVWYSGTADASIPSAYDWNISLPSLKGTGWTIGTNTRGAIPLIDEGNMALLIQGTFGGHVGDMSPTVVAFDPANITAISLKPNTLGNALWTQSYPQAPGNNTRWITGWDPSNGVFIFMDKESMVHYGYSLTDGSLLWGPVGYPNDTTADWNYQNLGTEQVNYGNLYVGGFSGIIYCFDDKTGNLLWTYGNGGEGNSTLSDLTTPWGRYPTAISTIADGKVYLVTNEHSPNTPLYKGAELRCINATDGTEIWTIMDYGGGADGGQCTIADGYLTTFNAYDCQVYCFGQGPSQTTVTAPDPVTSVGSPMVIRGTVTDISAGTTQNEQAMNFPNGVPCVSDASESAWMEYVYMQKPKPADATGVPVTIDVIDSNNNYRNIGTAISDSSGMFTLTWTPDISGNYTVIATFAGSNSYWGSSAETSFYATEAPTATPAPTPTPASMAEQYFLPMSVGLIIAMVVVIALLALSLLRKKP
jgi:outer membrane protein assembly factor BamB